MSEPECDMKRAKYVQILALLCRTTVRSGKDGRYSQKMRLLDITDRLPSTDSVQTLSLRGSVGAGASNPKPGET